jgi:hypothetical protein
MERGGENYIPGKFTALSERESGGSVLWRGVFLTRMWASCVMAAEARSTSWEWTELLVVVVNLQLHMQTISNFTANDIHFGAGYCLPRYIPPPTRRAVHSRVTELTNQQSRLVLTAVVTKSSVFLDVTSCQPTFRRNMSPPSSGSKNKSSKKSAWSRQQESAGGDMFLWNSVDVQRITRRYILEQWYSTFYVRVPTDIILFNFVPPELLVYNSSL